VRERERERVRERERAWELVSAEPVE
jgi:hypothetical protein